MKREQVMEMTDEQLRVKAAELLGAERPYLCCEDSFCPPTICLYGDEDVYDCIHLREGGLVDDCPEMRRGDLPDFLNDIAAAWGLWCEIPAEKALEFYTSTKNMKCVRVCMVRDETGVFEWKYSHIYDLGQLPRAITHAFILAMEAE